MAASGSCMVLQAIYSSMKTLLGPNKCLKCYVAQGQENAILGEAIQVLDALVTRVEHPVAQLLYDTCLTHQKLYGNGVTTIVCMACFWLREIESLSEEGIPCPVIFALFEEAFQVCQDVLGTSAVSMEMVYTHYRELEAVEDDVNVGAPAGTSPDTLKGIYSSSKTMKAAGTSSTQTFGNLGSIAGGKVATSSSQTFGNLGSIAGGKVATSSTQTFGNLGSIAGGKVATSSTQTFGNLGSIAGGKVGRLFASSSSQKARVLSFSRHFRPSQTAAINLSEPDTERNVYTLGYPKEGNVCGRDKHSRSFIQFVGSKLAHGREFAMSLAVRAVELQAQGQNLLNLLPNCNLVFTHRVLGVSHNHSEVLPGTVTPLEPEMAPAAHSLKRPVRILVVCGDATSSFSHTGLKRDVHVQHHVTSHDLHGGTSEWLESCVAVLQKHHIGFLAVGGSVCPSLWDHCLACGVVVASHLTHTQCQLLCTASACEPVHYISQCTERHIGEVLLQAVEAGGSWSRHRKWEKPQTHYCVIKAPPDQVVCTAVLCGKTKDYLDLLQQQFLNCLWRLRCAFEDGCFLPGGGLAEAACVREIQRRSDCCLTGGVSGRDKSPPFAMETTWMVDFLPHCRHKVYQAFHESLKLFISTTLMNSEPGLSVFEARAATETMVVAASKEAALKIAQVFDLKQSKSEGWLKAYHLARLMVQTL